MDKNSDPAYCFIFSPVECPAFPMTPIMTQPAIQSPACERGILAKHPPGRRRKAAEKAGSKDFMTPLTGDPTGLTCDPYVWGCLGGLR